MARKEQNPQQIIRKDSNNCFVEVVSNSFEIGRVLMRFYTYDKTRQAGNRITSQVDIYMTFPQFLRICYDILDSRNLIKAILADKQTAVKEANGGKAYPKPRILCMGGTSAAALAAKGKSRPDGMGISRMLKIMAGDKKPIILLAEQGAGEADKNGLIVPRFGTKPEQKVMIALSADDAKELFIYTREMIRAYLNYKASANFNPDNYKRQDNHSSVSNSHVPVPPEFDDEVVNTDPPQDFPRFVEKPAASTPTPTAPTTPAAPTAPVYDEPPEAPEFDLGDDLFGNNDFFGQ